MSEAALACVFCLGIFSLVGLGILRIGLQGQRDWERRLERERTRATGTVVGYVSRRRSFGRSSLITRQYPVVEFRVDGGLQRHACDCELSPDEFPVGTALEVLYEADDPARFHPEAYHRIEEGGNRHFIRFGLVWIACMAVGAWLAVRFL